MRKETKTGGVVTPAGIKTLSPYGKFHMTYLGYDFKHTSSGRVYTKGDFWHYFSNLTIGLVLDPKNPNPPPGFYLVGRPAD